MIDHSKELHVVFGTGFVGLSVMDESLRGPSLSTGHGLSQSAGGDRDSFRPAGS